MGHGWSAHDFGARILPRLRSESSLDLLLGSEAEYARRPQTHASTLFFRKEPCSHPHSTVASAHTLCCAFKRPRDLLAQQTRWRMPQKTPQRRSSNSRTRSGSVYSLSSVEDMINLLVVTDHHCSPRTPIWAARGVPVGPGQELRRDPADRAQIPVPPHHLLRSQRLC